MKKQKPIASLSLDLDNLWSYMKTRGDESWTEFPTYLDAIVPRALAFFAERNLKITWFIVGKDASVEVISRAQTKDERILRGDLQGLVALCAGQALNPAILLIRWPMAALVPVAALAEHQAII